VFRHPDDSISPKKGPKSEVSLTPIPPKEFSPRYVARMRPQGVVRARLDPRQRIRIEEKQDSLEARAATTVSCPPAGLLCLTRRPRPSSLWVVVGLVS
jgi:hypothetical protein